MKRYSVVVRRALVVGLALVLGVIWLGASAEGSAYLTHGPVVGGVTSTSARAFVRTSAAATVQILYSMHPDMTDAVATLAELSKSDSDFTLQLPLTDLVPKTRYYLNVLVNGAPQLSEVTQFKSFPPEGADAKLKLVVLTDFGSTIGSQPPVAKSQAFANAAAERPDFIFLGGDFDHRDPTTLDTKRQMFKDMYALNNPHADMNDFVTLILHKFPVAHQWDDHDYSKNDSNRFAEDRSISQQVFREYFPAYPFPSSSQIYQRFQYGEYDFFILDNRSERDTNAVPDSPTKSMLDGEHLGENGQLAWLLKGLEESKAKWKVIFSSSVFNPTSGKADSWRSFQYEHKHITDFISEKGIKNVLVVSGDFHSGALDNGLYAGLPEMVVPGPNLAYCYTVPSTATGYWTNGTYGDPARAANTVPCNGYGILNLTSRRAKFIIKDQNGKRHLRMRIKHQDE